VDDQRLPLWFPLGCLAVYAILVVLVAVGGPVDDLDRGVRDAIAAHHDPTLGDLAENLTSALSPGLDALVLVLGGGLVARRTRRLRPFLAAGVAGWTMAVVVLATKHALGRRSPLPFEPNMHGGSFPSGHTAAALVCLGAIVVLLRAVRPSWYRPLMTAVALLTTVVAAALVYDSFHWLSDTIGSIALGAGLLGLLQRQVSCWE
jgi:undecaprenyl-diphosphatase